MIWKRLADCPICGKDRCVVVPNRRNMVFCYRFYRAYWLRKDGTLQMLPENRKIIKDKQLIQESLPLFPIESCNFIFDPNNPYFVQEKKEGVSEMERDKIENDNPRWSRSAVYQLLEIFGKTEIYKNAKLQKIGLALMSQDYIDKKYINYIELAIDYTQGQQTLLVICRFSFLLAKPMGRIFLDEQICPSKEILGHLEKRLNEIFSKFVIALKEKELIKG